MNKIDLSDRETIKIGLVRKQPLKTIGEYINKETSSVSREKTSDKIQRK